MRKDFDYKIIAVAIVGLFFLGACSGGGSSPSPSPSPSPSYNPPTTTGYMNVSVSPTRSCGGTVNIACVSVTICNPNSTSSAITCTTVPDVLLDTGSFGLRVFKQFLSGVTLPNVTYNGDNVAECVTYADNSQNWGPVVSANVQLTADATAVNIPIQEIDRSFPGANSASCGNAAASPDSFGENGVLGVGPIVHDSGPYYACGNGSCTTIKTLPLDSEVVNPVAMLSDPSYNNGLTLQFPTVGDNGASNVTGSAILGVGTNLQNQVGSGVQVYPSNGTSSFPIGMPVQFNSSNINGFLDTGSNIFFFYDSSISKCSGNNSGYYCPSSSVLLTPANLSSSGNYVDTNVNIANANALFSTNNTAFSSVGYDSSGTGLNGFFDYGLPFFFGKTVYVGFDEKSSSIESGAYWAF